MTLHNILHDISEKSDADTSNLWHRIEHQLEEEKLMRKSKNRRLRLSVTWAMALLGILVMSSAIFGRNQRQLYHPVTIAEIERMASPLNLVETNYDLTIQLDWAYADATQIVLAYSAFDMDGNPVLANELAENGRVEIKHLHPNPDTSSLFSFFPPTVISELDAPQQVVRFSITGTYLARLNTLLDGFDLTESGFMAIQLNFFQNLSNMQYIPTHTFDIEIPFGLSTFEQHNDYIESFNDWDIDVTVEDIEVYFNDFVIADSSTHLFMCLQTPSDVEETWYLPNEVNLYVNNRAVETVSIPYQNFAQWSDIDGTRIRLDAIYFSNNGSFEDGYCVQFMWQLAFDELPQTIRVEIPEFHARIDHHPDNPISQDYIHLYAEEGYQLEYLYNEEFDDTSLVYPPELEALSFEDRRRIDERVREALNELYPLDERFSVGWEYTFEINSETE